jgi:hypothetical protein
VSDLTTEFSKREALMHALATQFANQPALSRSWLSSVDFGWGPERLLEKVVKKITFKTLVFKASPWAYAIKCGVAGSYNVYSGNFGNGNKYKLVGDFIAGCV